MASLLGVVDLLLIARGSPPGLIAIIGLISEIGGVLTLALPDVPTLDQYLYNGRLKRFRQVLDHTAGIGDTIQSYFEAGFGMNVNETIGLPTVLTLLTKSRKQEDWDKVADYTIREGESRVKKMEFGL